MLEISHARLNRGGGSKRQVLQPRKAKDRRINYYGSKPYRTISKFVPPTSSMVVPCWLGLLVILFLRNGFVFPAVLAWNCGESSFWTTKII